ncbi:MAG: iron ABC transporter permease [Chloroflexaceae bacterium]|jgi:iron complex transport system permease protein|nr:iron ABC transporter permease [Chloroflexaceae bacterium]
MRAIRQLRARLRQRVWPAALWGPLLLGGLALALLLSLGVGAVTLTPAQVMQALLSPDSPGLRPADVAIVWDLRLARALLAALVGAGLAGAGAAFQGLFRNPLADPFVIGASGGAALGATLAIISTGEGGPTVAVPLAAFAGSLLAVLLVYMLAAGSNDSITGLLLAGAALSTVVSALVSLLMLLNDRQLQEIFAWLLGSLSGRSWGHLWLTTPPLLLGLVTLWLLARPLDALACGDDNARSLGLPLRQMRLLLVVAASLTTAAAVAASGIVGFVGLVAPHIARLLCGTGHALLIPASALLGALLLLLADSSARTVAAPLELPVGIITALLGGPFFLWLLRKR